MTVILLVTVLPVILHDYNSKGSFKKSYFFSTPLNMSMHTKYQIFSRQKHEIKHILVHTCYSNHVPRWICFNTYQFSKITFLNYLTFN